MTSHPSQDHKFRKKYWIDILQSYYQDRNLSSDEDQITLWTQDVTDPITTSQSPRIIARNLIHFWNQWIQNFRSNHPVIFEYFSGRKVFTPGSSFLHNINIRKEKIDRSNLLHLCRHFSFDTFFIKLDQIISAIIDILDDKQERIIWIRHFFTQNPFYRKLILTLVKRIDPNSFIFRGRIHPSTE